jgi:hypothetical protein
MVLATLRAAAAAWAAMVALAGPVPAQPAQNRVALVIGNADYRHGAALRNPVNDARAMATTLRQAGFRVIARENATKQQMERAVGEFGRALTPGSVALFYFAGHGMQVGGRNFLLPTDAQIASEQALRLEALDVDIVLDQVAAAGSDVNLVILDACRNNPFERRFRAAGGGLAQINAPKGTLIAYATAPGKVAADGDADNGLYTEKLVQAIRTPGIPLEEVFKRVRIAVSRASNDQQTPWEASSLVGNFYFFGPATVTVAPAAPAPLPAAPPPAVPSPATRAFDGTWRTTVQCARAEDGAKGYTLNFLSEVKDGALFGQFHSPKTASSVTLSGTINADGTALLSANGRTGDEEYAVGRQPKGTAYSYTATARFDSGRGIGTRNELRACNLTFVRQ